MLYQYHVSTSTASLNEILGLKRAVNMLEGFKEGKAMEELCQKCSYK